MATWAQPQLIAKGSTTRNPLRYADRGLMYEVSSRVKRETVDGVKTFGPFRIFTKVEKYGQAGRHALTGRGLVTYLKIGQAWYRFDLNPGTEYVRQFYAEICANQPGEGNRSRYCGTIINDAALAQQATVLRNMAVDYYIAQLAQTTENVRDPFGPGKKGDTTPGAQLSQVLPDGVPGWALPAALGAGVLGFIWWRRNR